MCLMNAGERAAVLGSERSKDENGEQLSASRIHYRPFDSWAMSGDWNMFLPDDEELKGMRYCL